jgi:hypothetical protein
MKYITAAYSISALAKVGQASGDIKFRVIMGIR